jgi:hypothetical protein
MRSVGRKTRRASDFDLLYRVSAPVLSCALGVAALEIANNQDGSMTGARRGQKHPHATAQNRRDLTEW